MMGEGWLEDHWEEHAEGKKRPPSRYYKLTDEGRAGIEESRAGAALRGNEGEVRLMGSMMLVPGALGAFVIALLIDALVDDKDSPWMIRVLNLREMGSVGATLKTADAMRRSEPSHVVLVGICGGIPGRSNLIGDCASQRNDCWKRPSNTLEPTIVAVPGRIPGLRGLSSTAAV